MNEKTERSTVGRPMNGEIRSHHEVVAVLDFGSQYTQLIARRLREKRVFCEIYPPDVAASEIELQQPVGIILSGGPQSVYSKDSPSVDPDLLQLGVPTLGICYGMQLIAQQMGGSVESSEAREYGRADVEILSGSALFEGLAEQETVWMSHGDRVTQLPAGFQVQARTRNAPIVAFEDATRKIYGIQFHPEVSHTVSGEDILQNFLYGICGVRGDWSMASYLEEAIAAVSAKTGGERILCALSGGVDSSVVAALLSRAVGDKLTAVFVDTGLLRKDEPRKVLHSLRDGLNLEVIAVDAGERFLNALQGVTDPEEKRRIIGRIFIEVFDAEAERLEGIRFLAQGTLYPDVIESESVKGPSSLIKTHHNVGGLPEKFDFDLIEPLRFLFKDEVRALGRELGLPSEFIGRHPFPGPGLAVRILGEITPDRVAVLQEADAIFMDELRESGHYARVGQAFAVLLPVKSVGVMGDGRTYESVLALRSVTTEDFMTADWSHLPYDLLGRVANRIVNEVEGVNRVVYDITSKPPATIEWE